MGKGDGASAGPVRQGPLDDFRFGAIAAWGELVSREAVEEALAEQSARRARAEDTPPIGEMVRARGFLTDDEVRRVLRVQLQRLPAEGHLLFGQIAVAHRFATPEAVDGALDEQSRQILAAEPVRRLGEILIGMGAIRPEATRAILAYQTRRDSVPMAQEGKTRPGREAAPPGSAEEPLPGSPEARPVFLPRGARGFLYDHSIWIFAAAATAMALVLILFRESIFGA